MRLMGMRPGEGYGVMVGGVTAAARSCGFEDFEDGLGVLSPLGGFGAELIAAGLGELVVLGSPVVFGEPPLGLDEAFAFESVECLVERGVFDGEDVVGALADPSGDGVAVHGVPGEGLEDQDVEGALEQVHRRMRVRVR